MKTAKVDSARFILATTSKTERHNTELVRMGFSGEYKAPIHEIQRHYTYRFGGQNSPTIERIRSDTVAAEYAKSLKAEYQDKVTEDPSCICLLSMSLPANYDLKQWQSLQLVKMQLLAGMSHIRVFMGNGWSKRDCLDTWQRALQLNTDGSTLVPCLDMNMHPAIFSSVYAQLVQEGCRLMSHVYRAPNTISKVNYFYITSAAEDEVQKHISCLSWRRRDIARSATIPLAMWAVGFTSYAFGGRPAFVAVDDDDEPQQQTWNVQQQYIKFYNPSSRYIDKLQYFPQNQICSCPIHDKRSILLTAEEFYDTGSSAIFSSLHDLHEIQRELTVLGERTLQKIRKSAVLSELYINTIGRRRSQL